MINVIKSPLLNIEDKLKEQERTFKIDDVNPFNKKIIIVYIYRLPAFQNHGFKIGMTICKIGETFWDAIRKRIADQVHEVALPDAEEYQKYGQEREVVFWGVCLDAKSESFKDYYIHQNLLKDLAGITEKEQEWFTNVPLDKIITIFKKCRERGEKLLYKPRKEQQECVDKLLSYFSKNPTEGKFLMNCKMRFGKCFTTYLYAEKANINRILILTFVPAVEESWRDDLNHISKNYDYFTDDDLSNPKFSLREQTNPYVLFLSLQNLLGKDRNTKETKEKLKILQEIPFDLTVLDEYHFGAWNDRTQEKFEDVTSEYAKNLRSMVGKSKDNAAILESLKIQTKQKICLSGTPFKALARGEFTKDNTFTYSYFDEQRNKYPVPGNEKIINPDYAQFPDIKIMGYNMRVLFPDLPFLMHAEKDLFNRKYFSLNSFYETEKDKNDELPASFIYENEVKNWLGIMKGKSPFNGEYPYNSTYFDANHGHSLWLLPTQNACKAMENILKEDDFFNRFEIINLSQPEVGSGVKAKEYLDRHLIEAKNTGKVGSITLTVNKLTLGVTVKQWSNVFVLKDCSSPEQYFQSIFRIQTPYKDDKGNILKKVGYVFDFNIDRATSLMLKYAMESDREDQIDRLEMAKLIVRFMPIYKDGNMSEPISESVFYELAQNGDPFGMPISNRIRSSKTTRVTDPQALSELLNDKDASPILKRMFAHAKFVTPKTKTYAYLPEPDEDKKEFAKGVAIGYEWGKKDSDKYIDLDSASIQQEMDNHLNKLIDDYCQKEGLQKATSLINGIRKGYERGINAPIKKLNCGKDDGTKFALEMKKKLGKTITYNDTIRAMITNAIHQHLNKEENIPEEYRNKCLYNRWYKDSFKKSCINELRVKSDSELTMEDSENIMDHLLARLFEFLFISVYREMTFEEVFENADDKVFLSAVGITKKDFKVLNKNKLFNEYVLNNIIRDFFVNETLGRSMQNYDEETKRFYRNSFNWFGYGIDDEKEKN